MEGKMAPDGQTKPRSGGCESKVGSRGLMWRPEKERRITLDHVVSFLLAVRLLGRAAASFSLWLIDAAAPGLK